MEQYQYHDGIAFLYYSITEAGKKFGTYFLQFN